MAATVILNQLPAGKTPLEKKHTSKMAADGVHRVFAASSTRQHDWAGQSCRGCGVRKDWPGAKDPCRSTKPRR